MPTKKAIFDKKNILVVGGAGFVGSHLCDELVKDNKVICLDNFLTGSHDNIAHLLANPNFKFINHDIIIPAALENFPELKDFKIEFQGLQTIYFLASPTSSLAYLKLPLETLLVNSVGLRNSLDLAVKYKAQFLFASSPAVYGQAPIGRLIKEDYVGAVDQLSPRACFSEAKRFGETLTLNYRQQYNLDAKIVRIFNCYGPRLKLSDGRMIPELIRQAISNEEITIYGNEQSFGSYFYISDLIKALLKIMNSAEFGPINIASDWQNKYSAIAAKIIKLANSQSKITYQPLTENFQDQPLADITLAKEKLGWFPIVLLEEGLKKTVDYLTAQKDIRHPEDWL